MNNNHHSVEKEENGSIMSTDIYVRVDDNQRKLSEIQNDIEYAFDMFRNFEKRFSRFIENNELDIFNGLESGLLTEDLQRMLLLSKEYFAKTNKLFDIGILPILKSEGYVLSKNLGFNQKQDNFSQTTIFTSINKLHIDENSHEFHKPKDLKVDLGGIGKGYIVDQVAKFLADKYQNFIVDAGGDIRFSGANITENLPYWLCGVENPLKPGSDILLVKISDKSIATSGTNRRKWFYKNIEKNHIIDPMHKRSLRSKLLSCTVISDSTTDADIYAKSLLIMGLRKAITFANTNKIAMILVDQNSDIYKSMAFESYLYE